MNTEKIAHIVTEGKRCRIVYRCPDGAISERTIAVNRVYRRSPTGPCVVLAYCERRREYRTFALDGILFAAPEDDTNMVMFGRPTRVLPYSGETDSASRLRGWS